VSDWVLATCACCDIKQKVRYRADDATKDPQCDQCAGHRGRNVETRIKRAEEHAAAWRDRCEYATRKATEYEDRMKSAYRSRDRAIGLLRRLHDFHQPNRRGCSCGAKDCRSVQVLEGAWLRDMLRRLAFREASERHRAGWWDDFDEVDDKLMETIYPNTSAPREIGTAG